MTENAKMIDALTSVIERALTRKDGEIAIPSVGTFQRSTLETPSGKEGDVISIAFNPDSRILASDSDLQKTLAHAAAVSIPYVNLSEATIPKDVLGLIPEHIARQYFIVPVEVKPNAVTVAMIDPDDHEALEVVKKKIGKKIEVQIATQADIAHILDQYGEVQSEIKQIVEQAKAGKAAVKEAKPEQSKGIELRDFSEESPASKIVASLLKRAVREKASDIHIEPSETEVVVRFRVDGLLRKVVTLPKTVHAEITSRIKVLSDMKIDEQRLPQDGRFQINLDQGRIDFRVSTFPTVNGEKVVARILDTSAGVLTLEQLGFREEDLPALKGAISKAHGMTLVTGPTGSGKSTTLYAVLKELMKETVNIVTLEDPVEFRIPSINQSQVNAEIKYTFGAGLRSIVRQDPDIIMVGEIRDLESADLGIHAALTGHIVLSTLHTNDAAGATPRLIDMGIEPFLITSSVNAIIGQRLARKICEHCKEPLDVGADQEQLVKNEFDHIPAALKTKLKVDQLKFFHGKGCAQCNQSGYKGRVGLFELLLVTELVKQLIVQRVSASKIKEQAQKEGMITLMQDGLIKAVLGITTLEEVWRATKE